MQCSLYIIITIITIATIRTATKIASPITTPTATVTLAVSVGLVDTSKKIANNNFQYTLNHSTDVASVL